MSIFASAGLPWPVLAFTAGRKTVTAGERNIKNGKTAAETSQNNLIKSKDGAMTSGRAPVAVPKKGGRGFDDGEANPGPGKFEDGRDSRDDIFFR